MKSYLLGGVAQTACAISILAPAQAVAAQQNAISIPAGDLKTVLDTYARQTGRQLIYRSDQVRGARSPGARGAVSAQQALDAILSGTGFSARSDPSGAIAIIREKGIGTVTGSLTPTSWQVASAGGQDVNSPSQPPTDGAQEAAAPSDSSDAIVVTGYRRSLQESANAKKGATNFTDSIFSEDVGKFPDLNLAESLQRLPGVVIDRDRSGEGTTINVRGLSAGFTVTTINGFATTTTAYSGNEGRGSGLDVLPNELFRRLTVSKSPTANMVEGGTAGVVDMQPLSAFDRKGLNVSLQAQMAYQSASRTKTPRGALIVSNRFNTGIGEFGILGALAYAKKDYRSENFDTIGWTTLNVTQVCPTTAAGIASGCNPLTIPAGGYGNGAGARLTTVPGNVPAELGLGAQGSPLIQCLNGAPGGTSGLSCQDLSFALVPRLMRAEQTIGQRTRLGGLMNFEYRPRDGLRFQADVMFSDVKNKFRQHQQMMVVRSYNNQIPIDFELNDDRVLTSGTFANTYFLNQTDVGNTPSNLLYRSGRMDWDIVPKLHLTVSGMKNTGKLRNESLQLTLQSARPTVPLNFSPAGQPQRTLPAVNLTPNNTGQYGIYNYTPGDLTPSIQSNIDMATFRQYYWNEGRAGNAIQDLDQRAIRFDLTYGDATDLQVSAGYMKNIFDRRITSWAGGIAAGCFTRGLCGSNFISTQPSLVEAIPDSQLPNYMTELPSMNLFQGAPFDAGFNEGWLVPDIDKIGQVVDFDYFRDQINPGKDASNFLGSFERRDLLERTSAVYIMVDGRKDIFGKELRFNAGVRFADTFQQANGRVNDLILIGGTGPTIQTFSNDYENFLPSANFAYFVRGDLIVRGAAAKTITGVSPADLLPGYSLDLDATTFNRGNPKLQPFTADNFDVGIEWYPRSRSLVSFNAWWKKLYNYPYVVSSQVPFRDLGIDFTRLTARQQAGINAGGGPNNAILNVLQRENTDLVIHLAGQEFQLMQPLDFVVKGAGINFNVTHIKQSLSGERPAGLNPNALLAGLAPWTYNFTGYYETKAFQVRVSFVHRDETLASVGPDNNVPGDRFNAPSNYLDAQISFALPFYRKASVTLQAQNLLKEVQLSRFEKQEARPYNAVYTGRNFVVGLRANF